MADCIHIQHHELDECPGLTEAEIDLGEKIRSIGIHFSYGRDQFHGPTLREQQEEMFANAKKFGNEPPEYAGRAVLR